MEGGWWEEEEEEEDRPAPYSWQLCETDAAATSSWSKCADWWIVEGRYYLNINRLKCLNYIMHSGCLSMHVDIFPWYTLIQWDRAATHTHTQTDVIFGFYHIGFYQCWPTGRHGDRVAHESHEAFFNVEQWRENRFARGKVREEIRACHWTIGPSLLVSQIYMDLAKPGRWLGETPRSPELTNGCHANRRCGLKT